MTGRDHKDVTAVIDRLSRSGHPKRGSRLASALRLPGRLVGHIFFRLLQTTRVTR